MPSVVGKQNASPAELRKRFPAGLGDEEFLLRATMPADQVDAMLAAGPARRHYNPDLKPVLDLLAGLRKRPGVRRRRQQARLPPAAEGRPPEGSRL
jgi:hypothetical protein